jgi:CHAT domain-containing protein/tetratricopeptide (TPR) repeat protein
MNTSGAGPSRCLNAFALCAAIVVTDNAIGAATDLPPGVHAASRADIVAVGRTCGIGAPMAPAYVLSVGQATVQGAPSAVAVLRDDAGVAMPLLPHSDPDTYTLVDLTEAATSSQYSLGVLVFLQRGSSVWVTVDYKRPDLECRVTGTVVFAAVADDALAANVDTIARGLDAAGRRDALRAAGNSRDALVPATVAETLLRSALGPDHPLTLNAETNIGSLHWDLDEFTAARERFESAIPRIAAALGESHFHVWRARGNLALVWWDLGDLDRAESMLRQVAERYAMLLHEDDSHRLGTLINLGTLLNQRGRHVEAERTMLDVVVRFERTLGPDHPRTMISLNNLATLFENTGRLDDALLQYTTVVERYQRALGPRHPATLRARHNHASMLARMNRRDEAIPLFREVLAARREVSGARHSETLFTQHNLAVHLAHEGAFDEALALQRDVVEAREASSGPSNIETLRAQVVLGQVELSIGQRDVGLDRMRRARSVGVDAFGRNDRIVLEMGAKLGTAQRTSGDTAAARETLREVVTDLEAWRETGATTAAGRRDLFAPWVSTYKELAGLELVLGHVAAAFEQAERSKARTLVETLALRRGEARDVLPRDALEMLARLDRQLADAETEIARAPRDPSVRFPLEQRRTLIADEARALRQALRARYPKYAALSEARIVSVAEGARDLPAGAVFVSYLRDGDRVLAFTVDRRGRLQGRDLGTLPGLDDTVIAYRTLLLAQPGSESPLVWRLPDGRYRVALASEPGAVRVSDAAVIGAELTARLVEPLPELMRTQRWIISPDGALALVPFETLPYRGRPLVLTREISYAPSLTVYSLTARRGRAYERLADRSALYAMGAARYGSAPGTTSVKTSGVELARLANTLASDPLGVRRAYDVIGASWPELPTSAAEIRQVAAHFRTAGEVTVRSFGEATEARLIEDDRRGTLGRHRYVLLSAHGFLSTQAPSLSAVVLGQVDVTPEADGYVTAAEWTSYTLRSDLIVISACETGVGQVIEGEGVAGLPYALFVAGNRNALLTLWPVADRSTALFVSRFFGHLRAGLSQSAALTRTKREFASKGPYVAPLHWAPFVLWGG